MEGEERQLLELAEYARKEAQGVARVQEAAVAEAAAAVAEHEAEESLAQVRSEAD